MATWKRQSLLNENTGVFVDDHQPCAGSSQESPSNHVRTYRRSRNTFSLFKACCYAWAVSAFICGLAVHQSEKKLSDGGLKVHVSYAADGAFSLRQAGLTRQQSNGDTTTKQCKFDAVRWQGH